LSWSKNWPKPTEYVPPIDSLMRCQNVFRVLVATFMHATYNLTLFLSAEF
jgi:hypothetical protein